MLNKTGSSERGRWVQGWIIHTTGVIIKILKGLLGGQKWIGLHFQEAEDLIEWQIRQFKYLQNNFIFASNLRPRSKILLARKKNLTFKFLSRRGTANWN